MITLTKNSPNNQSPFSHTVSQIFFAFFTLSLQFLHTSYFFCGLPKSQISFLSSLIHWLFFVCLFVSSFSHLNPFFYLSLPVHLIKIINWCRENINHTVTSIWQRLQIKISSPDWNSTIVQLIKYQLATQLRYLLGISNLASSKQNSL